MQWGLVDFNFGIQTSISLVLSKKKKKNVCNIAYTI